MSRDDFDGSVLRATGSCSFRGVIARILRRAPHLPKQFPKGASIAVPEFGSIQTGISRKATGAWEADTHLPPTS